VYGPRDRLPGEPGPREGVTEVTEVYEERAGPPGPPPPGPPLLGNLWFWLALTGLVAVVIVLVGVLAARDDERGRRAVVPLVVGLRQARAVTVLERVGFDVDAQRTASAETRGIVIDQSPEPGTRLARDETVAIVVSSGPEVATTVETVTEAVEVVEVPDVVGDDHVAAGATIDGIDLIADSFPVESGEPRGTVVAQDPAGGTQLPPGAHVRLAVALGPGERPTGTVPDVTGPNEVEARAMAREAGFTVRTIDRPAPTAEERGEVILQRPAPGTTAPILAQIRLFVGR
jgi:eukaryotic-like serine/threonine-protein kinase